MHNERVLTVSALTEALKAHVGQAFGEIQVKGEISNFTAHRSGHWYFGIKDRGAVLNCVMFRGDNGRVGWMPSSGEAVLLTGGIDIYAPQGRYNLIARRMQREGDGDQAAALAALKRKLQEEGLFAPERKRPLPPLPRAVGVVTSPTGAAVRDIQQVLQRRFPGLHIILSPCRVQGEGSALEVQRAIQRLVDDGRAEVIIFGRGGGSPEDLAAFNDEALVRAVAACPIPTISAVGHEIDVSITDLVADLRAATPSHAAELVVPEREGLVMLVDELSDRLLAGMQRGLKHRQERLSGVTLVHPRRRIEDARLRLDGCLDRLVLGSRYSLERHRAGLGATAGRLHALSLLSVLDRGYSVMSKNGAVVRSTAEVQSGDSVEVRMADGSVAAQIT
jgi:exodeoxyribonuclease VII large subunit